jgi:hypothetical protein
MNKGQDPSVSTNITQWQVSESVTLKPVQQESESVAYKFSAPRRVLVVYENKDARDSLATPLGKLGHLGQVARVAVETRGL